MLPGHIQSVITCVWQLHSYSNKAAISLLYNNNYCVYMPCMLASLRQTALCGNLSPDCWNIWSRILILYINPTYLSDWHAGKSYQGHIPHCCTNWLTQILLFNWLSDQGLTDSLAHSLTDRWHISCNPASEWSPGLVIITYQHKHKQRATGY